MKLQLKSQYEVLKSIRKPTLPAPRAFKSAKDYKRSKWKNERD